ncbi:hypothetical protein FIBSPDRAFT_525796 [Athelia psychrophila]|uniref:Uncharacterized protein n=1 Tax=Athelia psychrophila TaxID=1759441 RepID=A0A166JJC2_9AGAM|nr:hypothetical protein FIBSPDRAFT_525796 [Fibularhizoctonia sp. CBS 109695]
MLRGYGRGSGVRVYLCKTPRTHHAPTLAPHARILAHPHPLPNACTSAPALLYARAGPRACAPAPTGTHHPTPRAQAHISQPPRPKCARQPYYAPEDTTNALSAAPGSEMYKHNEHALRCAPVRGASASRTSRTRCGVYTTNRGGLIEDCARPGS